jgi:hypothetical protein
MGYDIHITRQLNWFDEDAARQISIEEWKAIVLNDNEMRLHGFAEATTNAGDVVQVSNDGLSVWIKYSENGVNGNYAWFDYSRGNITCKNADEEIIKKMLGIAAKMSAKVQGDEGEIYESSPNDKVTGRHITESDDYTATDKKAWWKFW